MHSQRKLFLRYSYTTPHQIGASALYLPAYRPLLDGEGSNAGFPFPPRLSDVVWFFSSSLHVLVLSSMQFAYQSREEYL